MEITDSIKLINQVLIDSYGIDTISGEPMWRVVWSEDQYEHRLSDYTPSGIKLIYPKVQWLPKYKQWMPNTYVLERLVVIPDVSVPELPATKTSYEPMHPFVDKDKNPLPPTIQVARFIVDLVYATSGKGKVNVYKDPEAGLTQEQMIEQRNDRVKSLQQELYGNETAAGDALAHHHGVVVPHNFKGEN